jgi:hypothetical protein
MPSVPIRWGLIRDPSGTFAPQAVLSTKWDFDPVPILTWFVQRWQLETTVEEARAHRGIETSRQWSDRSVARTTPVFLGLSAIGTRAAAHLIADQPVPIPMTAWDQQQRATFSETRALVRRAWWRAEQFSRSGTQTEVVTIPRALFEHLTETLCYAA